MRVYFLRGIISNTGIYSSVLFVGPYPCNPIKKILWKASKRYKVYYCRAFVKHIPIESRLSAVMCAQRQLDPLLGRHAAQHVRRPLHSQRNERAGRQRAVLARRARPHVAPRRLHHSRRARLGFAHVHVHVRIHVRVHVQVNVPVRDSSRLAAFAVVRILWSVLRCLITKCTSTSDGWL